MNRHRARSSPAAHFGFWILDFGFGADGYRPRRAALLLEVVIALTVMVAAMGFLCAQLAGGMNMTTLAEEQFRATQLTDRMLALVQFDPDVQRRIAEEQQVEDDFSYDDGGNAYPGWFWRVTVTPVEPDVEDIGLVTIEILHQRDAAHPESLEGAAVVRQVALLKAAPAKIDLVADGGLTEEAAEQLRQTIPIPDFDPRAMDLQKLMSMNQEDMLGLASAVMGLAGQAGAGSDLSGFLSLLRNMGMQANEMPGGGNPFGGGELPPGSEEVVERIREAMAEQGVSPPGGGQTGPRPGRGPGRGVMPGGGTMPPPGGFTPGGPRGNRGGAPGGPGGGPAPGGRPGNRGAGPGGAGGGRGPGAGGGSGGGQPGIGQGSGPDGSYTLEDLIRMRDEYERNKGGNQ